MIHDWKKFPLQHHPIWGMLCRSCWDGQHWSFFKTDKGRMARGTSNCMLSKFKGLGGCECGCTDPGPRKIKFTGEGQTSIPMDDVIEIK